MAHAIITALAALGATALPLPLAPPGVVLRYRARLGQTATYAMSLEVGGEQVSLGERRPINIRAELEVSEEVIAQERDGSFWLRLRGRVLRVRDPSGTFGRGQHGAWPEVKVHMSRRGEVLETQAADTKGHVGPFGRAFCSTLTQVGGVILPRGPIQVGESWEWEKEGASQTNRLTGISGEAQPTAHVSSRGRRRITLEETSEALGLTTGLSGEESQRSELDLLVSLGVVARNRVEIRLQVEGETILALDRGPQSFPTRADLRIVSDARLVRLNGESVNLR